MEDMMCAMALKSTYGRQTHHTQAGLPVCCEQALILLSVTTSTSRCRLREEK
jgi:hypothetical protein